ncbi:hypothetical protein [Desulfosporosinus sp. BG]|uniref:hypothetical protein n=1 Tax=Desulfosporosinus sp. BG TaxID=1633135 RepID=UPI00083AC364|nr:hypothetical protein [Desulfosporosinus sp. BG]ODA40904.1 hypothetical protein DSBG_2345 [Desulfosporosinus sp. BG]
MFKLKNILIILISCMLMLGAGRITFAVGQSGSGSQSDSLQNKSSSSGQSTEKVSGQTNDQGNGQTTQKGSETEQVKGNSEALQAGKQEFNRNRELIRLTTEETTRVKAQIEDCSEDLKLHIQNRLLDRGNISAGEMTRYKAMIQILSQEREILSVHQGKIQEQLALLCQARLQGDIEAANTSMNNIRAEQQLRLLELAKILQNLKNFSVSN